ncbi:hypothetical protein BH20ACT2_BH20ACT2_09020 [soil metagenome]
MDDQVREKLLASSEMDQGFALVAMVSAILLRLRKPPLRLTVVPA